MKTLSTFTAAGWDFVGETANGTNDYWTINCTGNNGYPSLSWQGFVLKPYSVIYDGNGNTGGTAPSVNCYALNESVTVQAAGTLLKTGCTFDGWNTVANGTGTAYAVSATFTMPANNVMLYAQWLPDFTPGEIQATGQTICFNGTPGEIGNITNASGGNGNITYAWRSSADNFGSEISGATLSTYTPPSGSPSITSYRRYAHDGTVQTSFVQSTGTWTVTILPEFTPGAIATTGETICQNSSPSLTIGNSTSASGGSGTISYTWRSSASNFTSAISGANGSTYTPPGPVASTILYKRYAKDNTCNASPSVSAGTWTVLVRLSVGGKVNGGVQVCSGTNSTLLTLSGHSGSVIKWQSSTNRSSWSDISNTATTYTAQNLTVNTWFRAVVQNGACAVAYSNDAQITMGSNFKISGTAHYENNPKTLLDGLKITLKQGTTTIQSPVITGVSGHYEFSGLSNGTYSLIIEPADPSGQWQTWNGVNNTDYLLVSKHVAGTQLLPENPPVIRIAASVKLPHPIINDLDATTIRQAAKTSIGYTYFDTEKWVFSGIDASQGLTGISLNCADVVRDISGLCAGDVNGSHVPTLGLKLADQGVELLHRGVVPIRKEMTFAVTTGLLPSQAMQMGALTLMLNYDPSRIEITGVEMPENAGTKPWFVAENGILSIGWASLEPVVTRVVLP